VLLAAPSCTENDLDQSESNSILEILSVFNPKIEQELGQCQLDTSLECSVDGDCPIDSTGSSTGPCVLPLQACTISEWSVEMLNVPLNSGGGESPFNDIVVVTLDLIYDWDDALSVPGDPTSATQPVGQTILANQGGSINFFPIAVQDLVADQTTVGVTMVFRGKTVAGQDVSNVTGAQLIVENCAIP
jgi:hypothetical protein